MKAFDEIYVLYVNDVYRFLLCLSGDEKVSEELTQETFYKAYRNINRFEGKCKISVWLCQIAKNAYYSYCKKEKDTRKGPVSDSLVSNMDVSEDYISSQNRLSLHKILHTLDEPYKEVFSLKVFGELSYKEISEIFGKSESWARVTFYRAKEKIKTIYNESEGLR